MSFDGSATLFGAGTTLGPYRIVRALGQGGMGTVYEAVHTRLNKRVALKTLHRRLAMNPEATERFVREGRAAARLRHAHAVDVADVAIEDGTPYLVMEFLEGEDLSKLIERSAPLSSEQVVEVMLPVCAAIAAAHDEGIVHRDLKPENIFLARPKHGGLHPKVLDFGISKLVEADRDQLTNAESVLGSPYYMSPEHARGARYVNAGSDQYSLGVILYEALTGRRPIQKETLFAQLDAIMTETPMAPREIRPEIPPALEKIVLRAMDRDASQRFESVLALGRALLPFGSERTRAVWEPMFGAMPVDAAPPTPATPPTSAIPVAPSASATPAIPQTLEAVLPDTIAVGGDALAPSLGSTTLGASITRVVPAPRVARETPRWVMLGALAVVLIGGAGAVWRLTTSTPSSPAVRPATVASTPPRTYRANVTASPATATITIDDAPSGTGSTNAEFAANGATHWLRVTAPGYEPLAIAFRDEPPPARVELHAIAPSAPTIAAPAVPSTVQATHVEPTQATHVATNPVTSRPSTGTHHPATRATTPRHPTIPQTSTRTHRPANGSRIVY